MLDRTAILHRISLNLNPGLPHSSLIHHFNPIFLFPDSGAQGSQTGKVINLLIHLTDARFLSLFPASCSSIRGVWRIKRVSTMATQTCSDKGLSRLTGRLRVSLMFITFWQTKCPHKNLSFQWYKCRPFEEQLYTIFKCCLYISHNSPK